jgi:hypothetical protein
VAVEATADRPLIGLGLVMVLTTGVLRERPAGFVACTKKKVLVLELRLPRVRVVPAALIVDWVVGGKACP